MTKREATVRLTLADAREHLRQYRAYAESMRTIGRGFTPSHPFTPEHLDAIIGGVIGDAAINES